MRHRLSYLPAIAVSAFIALSFLVATSARADGDEAHSEFYRVPGQGIGLVTKGVGLATRSEGVRESGTIQIAGVPAGATIISAHLYWVIFALAPNPAMTFQSAPVTAEHIGASANTCWPNWSAASLNHVYRADVTAQVSGNGAYTVADFPSGPAGTDTQGASLVVLYYDPAQPRVGSVIVRDEAITKGENGAVSDTYTNLDVPELEAAWLHMGVGDGQVLTDPNLSFHVQGISFMNLGLPNRPNGPFIGEDGFNWDDLRFNVLPRLNNVGPTTARWQTSAGGDCLV